MNASRESANLDVLRAMAVLFVLVDHVFSFMGLGRDWYFRPSALGILGVLMFFVHTCLVLMFSLERQEAKLGRRRLFWNFMIRRCFRVYPLSMAIVTLVYVFRIPQINVTAGQFGPMHLSAREFISNLLLTQNLDGSTPIVMALWSLPFEMQMYLFLPALYVLVRKTGSLRILLAMWLVAVPLAVVQFKFGFQPRLLWLVPCFLPGVMAYAATGKARPKWPFWSFVAAMIAAAWIHMVVSRSAATFKGMPICLGLGLTLPYFVEVASPWVRLVSHLIARYSYGIYLTHMICQWLAFVQLGHLAPALQWGVFAVTVVGVPVLLYHTLEAPMIRLGNRLVDRWNGLTPRRAPESEVAMDATTVP